jgi:hypothetical protein
VDRPDVLVFDCRNEYESEVRPSLEQQGDHGCWSRRLECAITNLLN